MREAGSDRVRIVAIVALGGLAAVAEGAALVLIVPLAESVSTERGIGGRIGSLIGTPSPGTVIGLGIGLTIVAAGFRVIGVVSQARLSRRVENEQKRRAYRAYLDAQPSSQRANRSGHLLETVNRGSSKGERIGHVISVGRAVVSVGVFVVGAVVVQPAGAVVIMAIGAVMFFAFRPVIVRSRAASRESTLAQLPVTEHLAESEGARLEIRTFGAEPWALGRFNALVDRLTAARVRQALLSGLLTPVYQGSAMVGIFAVLYVARSSEGVDLPSIGAVALLLLRSLSYGQAFQTSYQRVQEVAAVAEAFEDSVRSLEQDRAGWGSATLDPVERVEVDDLRFAYDSGGPALDSVSFEVLRGERVGIVGPSGAGKTTLMNVLLRLLRPDGGEVRINGRVVEEYSAESWARQVSVVPQHPVLLHGTVHENVAFFREGVSREDVVAAAKTAALDDLIRTLPEGYDTVVGPSTRALSGGQVQRIGLARLMAGHPTLLLLDEPTSALDIDAESLIRTSLTQLADDTTVIIVAHRMTTLSFCDRILVFEEGRLVADGPPDEVSVDTRYFEVMS